MSASSATPRPWWIDGPHKESYVQLIRANGPGGNRAAIANIYTYRGIEQAEADARLIVQAVNVHEELVKLAKRIDYFGQALIQREYEPGSLAVTELVEAARKAVEKLERP